MCAWSSGRSSTRRARRPAGAAAVDPLEHLGLAAAVARRFARPGLDPDDLLQAARVGLVQAAHRYDPRCGAAFSTFAVPYMVGEIRRLLDRSRAASGTRTAREWVRRAGEAASRLEQTLGRPATLAEVAAEVGCDPVELAAAIGALAAPLPYGEPEQGGAAPAAGGAGAGPAEDPATWEQLAVRLALRRLPAAMTRLIYLRFYLGLAQHEAAASLGVSQPTVSRWEREALARLRGQLEDSVGPGPFQRSRDLPEGLASGTAKRDSGGGRRSGEFPRTGARPSGMGESCPIHHTKEC